MGKQNFGQRILIEIAELFGPLREAISDPENFSAFMRDLNWDFSNTIPTQFQGMIPFFESLDDAIDAEEIDGQLLDTIITGAYAIISTVEAFCETSENFFNDDATAADFASQFTQQLLEYLVRSYLFGSLTPIGSILNFAGIVETESIPSVGELPKKIEWKKIPAFISDPIGHITSHYKYGDMEFESQKLLRNITRVAQALGVRPYYLRPSNTDANDDSDASNAEEYNRVLHVPLTGQYLLSDQTEVGVGFQKLCAKSGLLPGIAILPYATGQMDTELEFGAGFVLGIKGNIDLDGGPGIFIRPNRNICFPQDEEKESSVNVSGMLELALKNKTYDSEKLLLFGTEDGSRFGAAQISLKGGVDAKNNKDVEVYVELDIEDAAIVVKPAADEIDSFINEILPKDGIEIDFGLVLGVSNLRGLYFDGSGALEIYLPVHVVLGPVEIYKAFVSIGIDDQAIPIGIGCSISGELGPVSFAIEGLGLRGNITFPLNQKGNLGPVNLDLGFLFPTGVGCAIDAGVLVGGGFIDFDDVNQRYSGALALQLGEIGVTAIGLIATRMPDGSEGYSMLVNIGVTFEPAIQIYAGFSLAGVGGLVGVNRTMETEVLREGLKKGTLDSILFPDPASVIANANKIISDMRSVFPPEEGRFVVGPMLKIGWGTPTILTGEIGVFVETPEPVRVALMGQVEMALPDEEFEIVGIHIDILGTLDIERKELSFQASIQGTGMGAFELYGDCAFFLRWGDNPEMALAIGGFHPKFVPPPPRSIFSDLQQLRLNLTYGPLVQLRFGGYLALTPNSLQFGARVELFVGVVAVDAGISGFLSFDALFNFSPFSFEVGMTGGMAISVMGVNLANIRVGCTLSGPNPWNIRGTATVNVLFCDIDCGFNITWGLPSTELTAPIEIWLTLHKALERTESWGSQLPAGASLVESLRTIDEEPQDEDVPAPVIVHPAGTLEVRQNVVPLEITLDKFGNAPPQDYDRFKIKGARNLDEGNTVDEFFSRGRFEDLSNQQKLSLPSFEKLPGGLTTRSSNRLSVTGVCAGQAVSYESITIKPDRTTQKAPNPEKAVSSWSQTRFIAKGNAAGRGALLKKGRARFAACGKPKVGAQEEKYVVVNVETLTPFSLNSRVDAHGISVQAEQAMAQQFALYPRVVDVGTLTSFSLDSRVDVPANGMTRVQAEQVMAQYLALYPRLVGNLTVVAEYEAWEAA